MAVATFAAGCFWGVEERFAAPRRHRDRSRLHGRHEEEPTYRQVCSHKTGHAEAVRVEYDPDEDQLRAAARGLLRHARPDQVNRQGPDVGSQYRSAIFYHTPEQERAARDAVRRLDTSGELKRPVVTQIAAAGPWWPAEEYHQKYFMKHAGYGCAV